MSAVNAEIIEKIVAVRSAQTAAIAALGIPSAPTISRLRAEAEVAREFREIFQDLGLEAPQLRGDGNRVGAELDHLVRLQPYGRRQWRGAKLGQIAMNEPAVFESIAADIVADARAIAADRTVGSLHDADRMRPIVRTDSTGVTTTRWCGKPDHWMRFLHDPVIRCLNAVGDGRGTWY
jgi:hypothetical protein